MEMWDIWGPSEDGSDDQAGDIAVDMQRAGVMHLIAGDKTALVLRAAAGGIGMQFSAQQPIDTILVAMPDAVLVHEVNGLREASRGQSMRVARPAMENTIDTIESESQKAPT
jgi:hypothetical protein